MPSRVGKTNEMRKVNGEAYMLSLKIPPGFWSRSRFSFNSNCDALLNMSETFNSVIVGPKGKPIVSFVTVLEEITFL